MRLFPPAKINLSLRVLGRRKDGFHEIDTVVAPISIFDELTIDLGSDFFFASDDPGIPFDENLVVKAARSFFDAIGEPSHGRFVLRKNIPQSAGLGGGSSDAASTLLGLNALYGAPLSAAQLTSLGTRLGSDVPFFLARSPARCRGRGEIVEQSQSIPSLPLLLFKPEFGVATRQAYQLWGGRPSSTHSLGEFALQNDLEPPVFEKYLFLGRMKSWLEAQPEVAGALLSGSGSTVFAVLHGVDGAHLEARARHELDPKLWVRSANILPTE